MSYRDLENGRGLDFNAVRRNSGIKGVLDYELPKLVDKYVTGWLATCGSGTLASTLLAAVAGGIFVHIQEKVESISTTSSRSLDALLIFAYLAVLANCSSTITSFLISDKLVEAPLKAAIPTRPLATDVKGDLNRFVPDYIQWNLWTFFQTYWTLNLFIGFLCIFAELILYLWIFESRLVVKIVVTACAGVGLLPLVIFFVDAMHNTIRGG